MTSPQRGLRTTGSKKNIICSARLCCSDGEAGWTQPTFLLTHGGPQDAATAASHSGNTPMSSCSGRPRSADRSDVYIVTDFCSAPRMWRDGDSQCGCLRVIASAHSVYAPRRISSPGGCSARQVTDRQQLAGLREEDTKLLLHDRFIVNTDE